MRRALTQRGATLIELAVALAVAGIIAAVAYPSFQQHVIRTRRTEGQGALQALMGQQERYFTQNNRYIAFAPDATDPDALQFRWWSGTSAPNSAYEIEGKACDGEDIADCVQLVATPGTARVDRHFRDAACDTLILTSTGLRLASGPGPRCWR